LRDQAGGEKGFVSGDVSDMTGIAVVIPCYNLGRTVEEAVESVEQQARPAAELVIVDDGSDDVYTRQILARLERRGISLTRTPNRGVAAARNLGVALTSAPYLVLLDADDALEPAYLERLGGVLDARADLDFVTCAIQAFGDAEYTWSPPPCTWVDTLVKGGPHISTMFRRALWERVGEFDERLPGYEDTDFWLSAIEAGSQGVVLDEPLLRYRVRSGSRYHRAIGPRRFLPAMEAIYRKHWPAMERSWREVLLAKDAFVRHQRAHQRSLTDRCLEAEAQLTTLRGRVAEVREMVQTRGKDPLAWGGLRRLTPVSPVWGLDRGRPLDRYYIERFLGRHQADIQGRVLEVKDAGYTKCFGDSRVTRSDVVDIDPSNEQATIIADLTRAETIPDETFDCFVMTQTLHIIYDLEAALSTAYRILKPGGVLLCTLPCVSRVSYEDGGVNDGDFWRFTEASARWLFSQVFPIDAFEVTSYGNVMVCAAFLLGLALEEVKAEDLDAVDPWFPLICCVRAVKSEAARREDRSSRVGARQMAEGNATKRPPVTPFEGAILFYHRIATLPSDTHGLCVSPSDFRAHMSHLRERYHPMTVDDLVAAVTAGEAPKGAVAVTFDDGYLNSLVTASPILVEFGIPATFYVNTEGLDQEREFWWDVLERIFVSRSKLPASLDLHGDGTWHHPTRTPEERAAAHRALIETVFPLPSAEREALMARVAAWSGLDLAPRPTHRPMLWKELKRLAERPQHTIGNHAIHHLSLPGQPAEVQRKEVAESKRTLEGLLQRPVTSFSYPYGQFSRETVAVVRDAGFDTAVTVEGRVIRPGARRLLLPRFEIKGCDLDEFAEQLRQMLPRAHH
jgi:peptidoglycan/xylan/chitin deacetylase (PgdA/CDA1 family)/GT2 family glycosyltransferase/SAM-dependent methyltransferase